MTIISRFQTLTVALLAALPAAGAGCADDGTMPMTAQDESPTVIISASPTYPASASTTATYGIIKWVTDRQPDGDYHVQGIKANGRAEYDAWTWTSSNGNWWNYASTDVQMGVRTDGSEGYAFPEDQPWKFEYEAAVVQAFNDDLEAWGEAHGVAYMSCGWRYFYVLGAAAVTGMACGAAAGTGGIATPACIGAALTFARLAQDYSDNCT